MASVAASRVDISSRKEATRCWAVLTRSNKCSWTRLSSPSSEGPQLAGSVTIAFGQRDDDAASDHQHRHVVDCFGGKLVLFTDFEAEDITREVEASDLTPAIAEDLISPRRAL